MVGEIAELEEIEGSNLARLRLITHNARLVDLRKEHEMTQLAMVKATGIPQTRLREIENLRLIPSDEDMAKIACILGKPIDYLFSEELLAAIKLGVFSRRKVELDTPEIISLTEAQRLKLVTAGDVVEKEVDAKLLGEQIDEVLDSLSPRERTVLRLRFGFEGNPLLLEEVGKRFNVTRERIHQIEAKALRKLRHSYRSRMLKDYLE